MTVISALGPCSVSRIRSRVTGVLAALAASVILLVPAAAGAATITVDSTADVVDNDGQCTLREAIIAANNDAAANECLPGTGDDTIVFEPALAGSTIVLGVAGADEDGNLTGDLDVDDPDGDELTIRGPGDGDPQSIVVDADGIDRALHAFSELTLRNITIRGGRVGPAPGFVLGGGVTVDVGGALTMSDCRVVDNSVISVDNDALGGGVAVAGSFHMSGCEVSGNSAVTDGATAGAQGGGVTVFIDAANSHEIDESRIVDNTAEATGDGGAIGGGLSLFSETGSGDASIADSEISRNVTRDAGGTAGDPNVGGGGVLTLVDTNIVNTTISGNSSEAVAGDAQGGGLLYLDPSAAGGTVTLSNTTVTGNSAQAGGTAEGGGIAVIQGGTFRMANTVVADNSAPPAPDCFADAGSGFDSRGHNLIAEEFGCGFTAVVNDLVGSTSDGTTIDAMLAPLADNGGPTRTHAPMEGSPVIDAGNPNPVMAGMLPACEPEDQRGESRPADGDEDGGAACDIGAFELRAGSAGTGSGGGGGAQAPLVLALLAWLAHRKRSRSPCSRSSCWPCPVSSVRPRPAVPGRRRQSLIAVWCRPPTVRSMTGAGPGYGLVSPAEICFTWAGSRRVPRGTPPGPSPGGRTMHTPKSMPIHRRRCSATRPGTAAVGVAAAILLAAAVSPVAADPGLPHSFVPGETASASEVNENFRYVAPKNVVHVSVPDDGSVVDAGNALLEAVDVGELTAINGAPSAGNPYLVKLAPGTYDLGNQSLQMAAFVDVAGSGRGVTTIESSVEGTGGVVRGPGPGGGELRDVTVVNGSTGATVVGIAIDASALRVRNVTVDIATGPSGGSVTGIHATNGAVPDVRHSRIELRGAGVLAGFATDSSRIPRIELHDVEVSVVGSGNNVRGIEIGSDFTVGRIDDANVVVHNSGSQDAVALRICCSANNEVRLRESELVASADSNTATAVRLDNSLMSLYIERSTLRAGELGSGDFYVDNSGGSAVRIATSQVAGDLADGSNEGGSVECIWVYTKGFDDANGDGSGGHLCPQAVL